METSTTTNTTVIYGYDHNYVYQVSATFGEATMGNASVPFEGSKALTNETLPAPSLFLDWGGTLRIPLYSIIFALALCGNCLVIATLIQNKRMRTVTNAFIMNLAVSDLLLAVFCMPFTLVPVLMKNFTFGNTMCVLLRYLQGVSVSVNCFTLVALSLERYYAICQPLKSRRWQTLSHAYRAILLTWLLAFTVTIPIAVSNKIVVLKTGGKACRELWYPAYIEVIYTVILDVILLVSPMIIMLTTYGLIARQLWIGMKMDRKSQREAWRVAASDECQKMIDTGNPDVVNGTKQNDICRRFTADELNANPTALRSTHLEKNLANKKKVIKMLIVVVLEYFTCWAPLFITNTWIAIDHDDARMKMSLMAKSLIHLLSYVSSCCNPITYCFMNRKFRQGFLSAFRSCGLKRTFRKKRNSNGTFTAEYCSTRTCTAVSFVNNPLKREDARTSMSSI